MRSEREAGIEPQRGVTGALLDEARSAVAAGVAGATAGVLVAGIGGRLLMRVSMLVADGPVQGRLTENGNRIGEFTLEGTIGLLIFGGLLTGLIAGIYWYAIRPSLRLLGRAELPAAALAAVALGGSLIIDPENRDFIILEPAAVQVALFVALVGLTGFATAVFDRLFERVLPRRAGALFVYLPMLAIGVLMLLPAMGSLISPTFCFCEDPPVVTGILLMIALAAAVGAAMWRLVESDAGPPTWFKIGGFVATAGAVLAGSIHLIGRIIETV